MPNFKEDKSKFTMKNMNYYKGKHAASEANSPYNKNGSAYIPFIGKHAAEITEEFVNVPLQNMIRKKGEIKRTMTKNLHKKEYTPQTKSRKDISTDITPQTQQGKPKMMSKVTKKNLHKK